MDKRKNNLEWLRAILDANGVSQKEVAAAIGEAPANFNRILNGGRSYREGSEKLGKLKAFCQKRFGLVSGDWKDPPRPFAGSESLREIADRFFVQSSEALLSWKWTRPTDPGLVFRAVDAAVACMDKLTLVQIVCILEPLSDYLHEKRDFEHWAKWVRKVQQTLEFASSDIPPLLVEVLKLRCTMLAGEIARHEKFKRNLDAETYRKAKVWSPSAERKKNENESLLKAMIRPNFEAAAEGLDALIDEIDFCRNTEGFESVSSVGTERGKRKVRGKTGTEGKKGPDVSLDDVFRYARFCRIRARLQLGGYLSWSSVSTERIRAARLLTLAAEEGRELVAECQSLKPDAEIPLVGGSRRILYVHSCVVRRLAREFAKRSSSSAVPLDTARQHRASAMALYDESEAMAERAAGLPGAGIREKRNLVRTLSFATMFLLDCHRAGRAIANGLALAEEKTGKAAAILREIARKNPADGSFWVSPDAGAEIAGKLPFDTEFAMRMFIEVRIQSGGWDLPPLPKSMDHQVALADYGLPLVRRFFELADTFRHLFKYRSGLLSSDGEMVPRTFLRDLYDQKNMGGVLTQDLFCFATDPKNRLALADPFEGVFFASDPSLATQVDLLGKMLIVRAIDGSDANNGLQPACRTVLVPSKMVACLQELVSPTPGASRGQIRLGQKTDLCLMVKLVFRQLHESFRRALENMGEKVSDDPATEKKPGEKVSDDLASEKKRESLRKAAHQSYYSEVSVLERPDRPLSVGEMAAFERNFALKSNRGETKFVYDRALEARLSPSGDSTVAVGNLPTADSIVSFGLGFSGKSQPPLPIDRPAFGSNQGTPGGKYTWKPSPGRENELFRALFIRWTSLPDGLRTEAKFRDEFGLSAVLCSKLLSDRDSENNSPQVPPSVCRKLSRVFGFDPSLFDRRTWTPFWNERECEAVEVLAELSERIFTRTSGKVAGAENRRQALWLLAALLLMFHGIAPSDERILAAAETIPILAAAWQDRGASAHAIGGLLRRIVLFDSGNPGEGAGRTIRAFTIEQLAQSKYGENGFVPPGESARPASAAKFWVGEHRHFQEALEKSKSIRWKRDPSSASDETSAAPCDPLEWATLLPRN